MNSRRIRGDVEGAARAERDVLAERLQAAAAAAYSSGFRAGIEAAAKHVLDRDLGNAIEINVAEDIRALPVPNQENPHAD